jgi:alcohol dehydrogenase, propanol-preferring
MKAAVVNKVREQMVIKQIADPSPGARDAIVHVKACGICHTDLHICEGLLGEAFPCVLGHEIVGVVEQVGSEVTNLKPGDRVGIYFFISCGQCKYCAAGEEEACIRWQTGPQICGFTLGGGYAQYVSAPAAYCIPLPRALDYVATVPLFCAGSTVYEGLKQAAVRAGQRVAVLGIGGLGHLALQIAKAMGAEVIAITSTDSKAELAKKLGADSVVVGDGNIGEKLLAIGGADVVLSTTEDPHAIEQVISGILPKGCLTLAGFGTAPISITPMALVTGQKRIIGHQFGSRKDMRELLELAAKNKIEAVTESFPLEEANAAHQRLRENRMRLRGVLIPD